MMGVVKGDYIWRWAPEEIEELARLYEDDQMSMDDIYKAFPDRTPNSIKSKAYTLRLSKVKGWSDEEISMLIRKYLVDIESDCDSLLSAIPTRKLDGIHQMASRLRLSYLQDDICKKYGVKHEKANSV